MKVGIGASSDVQATVARCQKLGVECVYIGSLPGYEENGYPDANRLRELKGGLEDHGLEVPSVTYHFARWPSRPWRTERSMNPDILLNRDRRCIDAMLRTLEVLGEVGIGSVLHYVSLGKPMNPAQEEACWEGLIDIYRELIPAAEANGVNIANHSLHRILPDDVREWAVAADVRIEDYGNFRSDAWGGPFLVGTWKELRRLINAVPSRRMGWHYVPAWIFQVEMCRHWWQNLQIRFTSANFETIRSDGLLDGRFRSVRVGLISALLSTLCGIVTTEAF